jgi:hypothetical protein
MPIQVPPRFLLDPTEWAAQALAEGRGESVFRLWRELARVVLALSVRARGWQIRPAGTWMAVLPRDSTCSLLGKVCGLASRIPLDRDTRSQLQQLSSAGHVDDVVERAARALSRGLSASEHLSDAMVREITGSLLQCVAASAAQFEASAPRADAMPTPAPGEPDLELAAWIIFQSARPRAGREVDAALEYCKELAHVLLVRDLVFAFGEPPGSSRAPREVDKEMDRAIALQRQGALRFGDAGKSEGDSLLREAMTIFYECGRADLDCGWEAGVIACLIPLAHRAGSREDGMTLLMGAVEIGRAATARRREESVEVLSFALNELAHRLGYSDAALAALQEAIEVLWPLFLCRPRQYVERLAALHRDHRAVCESLGRPHSADLSRMASIFDDALNYEIAMASQAPREV